MIPTVLVNLVTFPGIIVHEIAHEICCWIARVRVLKVCYFRPGNPAGYVVHETPESPTGHLLICLGPLLVNTLIGGGAALLYHLPSFHRTTAGYVSLWLGISIAMHAFPSVGDAKSMLKGMWGKGSSTMAAIISIPIALVIYIGAIASVLWLDLIYGIAIALYLPKILLQLIRAAGI